MQKFKTHRSPDELAEECARRKWPLHTERFDAGSDYVSFDFKVGRVRGIALFSTASGRFFGKTKSGVEFSSDNAIHDGEPWFDQLLAACYIPLDTPAE